MKILITGGTGLIGQALIKALVLNDHQIVLFTRNKKLDPHIFAEPFPHFESVIDSLEDVDFNQLDAVINLAGEPIIKKRWSASQKQTLCNSRWQLTSCLAEKISQADTPPSVFISGSAIGVYGRQGDRHIAERFTEYYPEFSSKLCLEWESLALKAQTNKTRVCLLRTGIVLSRQGGALTKMLPAFRLGLGGAIANGQQGMSWIHIDDMVAAIQFILNESKIQGVVNLTSPNPVSNKTFSRLLAKQLHRLCIFPLPAFLLKILMGEMSDLLIYGQYVYPQKLLDAGYQFHFEHLEGAFQDLLT